jgi:hypothetical protein
VQHHDDVGAARQRLGVAGLLVAAIAGIMIMRQRADAKPPGKLDGGILAAVIG